MLTPNIRKQLDRIEITKENGHRKVKCFCGEICNKSIVPHLKSEHPNDWRDWTINFVKLRNKGLTYFNIIKQFKTTDDRFLFTSSVAERGVQRIVEEEQLKLEVPFKETIEEWQPKNFRIKRETFWIFTRRGSWAVHQGDYRGNWSPYIPRTLIELYSDEGDIVLDPFVGGGTTLIETWLTNRRGFGLDINPLAVTMANSRIQEMLEKSMYDPRISLRKDLMPHVIEGDSRELKNHLGKFKIVDGSVKLVCAHPPYLNALKYTVAVENDLSRISDCSKFCDELQSIATQIFDLLADDGTCAVLVGDVRRNKRVIPLGFLVMERFINEDFKLGEIIVKAQHQDSSTRFYYTKRDKLDFLIAHEYLFIFSK